jgi:hypothetical protein
MPTTMSPEVHRIDIDQSSALLRALSVLRQLRIIELAAGP